MLSLRSARATSIGFSLAMLGVSVLTGILVARALGPTGRGELAAILISASLAVAVSDFGSAAAVTSIGGASGAAPIAARLALRSAAIWALPAGLVATLVAVRLSGAAGDILLITGFVVANVSLGLPTKILLAALAAAGRFGIWNGLRMTLVVVYAVLVLAGFLCGVQHLSFYLATNLVANAVVALLAFIAWRGASKGENPAALGRREFSQRRRQMFLPSLATLDTLQVDALLVGAVFGPTGLGLYVVAQAGAAPVRQVGPTSVPHALRLVPDHVRENSQLSSIWSEFRRVLVVGLLIGAISVPLAVFLIPVLYGPEFDGAVPLVTWVTLLALTSSLRMVVVSLLAAYEVRGVSVVELGTLFAAALLVLAFAKSIPMIPALFAISNVVVVASVVRLAVRQDRLRPAISGKD